MRRLIAGAALAMAMAVAGAHAAQVERGLTHPLPSAALPVPPPPPPPQQRADDADGFVAAPIPNPDMQRPRADMLAERPRTEWVPGLYNPSGRRDGQGYLKGSAPRYEPEGKGFRPSPSISLRVPLK